MTTTTSQQPVRPAAQPRTAVDEPRWARSAAVGGFLFVVLNVIAAFAPGTPPASDASAARIAAYFRDHGGAVKAQLLLGGIGIAALLWWSGALWRIISRAEDGGPRLAVVAAVSLTTGLTLALVSGIATSTAAIRLGSGDTAQLLFGMSLVAIAAGGIAIAAFLVATGVVTYRTQVVPRWTSYLGWAAALAFLVGGIGTVTDSNAVNLIGLAAFLIWCVWIVVMSVFMWRDGASA